MSELVVFAFDDESGAKEMEDEIAALQKQKFITLEDAAYVVRNKEDGKVRVKQATNLVGAGALGGASWGMMIGMLFFAPWMGLAIGAVTGATAGKFTDTGIDDKFIKEVGETIEPGHSALFLFIREGATDKTMDELGKFDATVVRTSLSEEEEVKLKEAFGSGVEYSRPPGDPTTPPPKKRKQSSEEEAEEVSDV